MMIEPPPHPELGPTGSRITEWAARDVSMYTYVAGFMGVQPKWVADFVCADGTTGFAGWWPPQPGWGWGYWSPPENKSASAGGRS